MADRADLREQTQFYFDKIMRVLQEMPRPMLLFVRNLNLVRSICRDHGDPVNRHEVLIYTALLGLQSNGSTSLFGNFVAWIEWRKYAVYIKLEKLSEWAFFCGLRVLFWLGLAPDPREVQSIAMSTPTRIPCIGINL